jgi:endoglucanase
MSTRRLIVLSALVAMTAVAACFSGESASPNVVVAARTCEVKGTPPMAPGGYYTQGASVCTADGKPHLFNGVDRPSLEFTNTGQWNGLSGIPASDFQAMASWRANAVRIATNQDFWLSGATLYDPNYPATIAKAVHDAEAAGLDVILDLHWSDCGNLKVPSLAGQNRSDTTTVSGQQIMADVNSVQFWKEVATMFKDDGHVLFELYNEPNGVPWSEWLSGGNSVAACPTVGMQALYNAVRMPAPAGAGAQNLVILGGLSYAFDLSQVQNYPIAGAYNLMYATHPYPTNDSESDWASSFGYLTDGNLAPVIATEFGDTTTNCRGQWDTDLINFSATNKMSWTAWAWWATGPSNPNSMELQNAVQGACSFPALLLDWSYTPSVQGIAVRAALAMDPVPVPPPVDAGPDGAAAEGGVVDATLPSDATPDQDAEPLTQDAAPEGAAGLDASEDADSSGASDGAANEGMASDGGGGDGGTPDGS